jgi:hypothetical protein
MENEKCLDHAQLYSQYLKGRDYLVDLRAGGNIKFFLKTRCGCRLDRELSNVSAGVPPYVI